MWKNILLLIVIVLHVAIIGTLLFGKNISCSAPAPDETAGTATPAEETPGGAEPAVPGLSTPAVQPYSPAYYAMRLQTLPAALEKSVADCAAALVIDADQHTILWGKSITQTRPLASLTKMMTTLLLMEELNRPGATLTLQTTVKVSVAASKVGGHQVWLDPRESFTIDELLKCILIRSANDCAYLIGEYLANGDHEAFVRRMNARARELGCTTFEFHNSHGLPQGSPPRENMGTMPELAYLAEQLWKYPEAMKWAGTRQEFIRENTRKPFQLDSTNRLLRTTPGVCGLKTGMTNKAGFCIVITSEREGRRRIVIVMGCTQAKVRDAIAEKLVEWSYSIP